MLLYMVVISSIILLTTYGAIVGTIIAYNSDNVEFSRDLLRDALFIG